MVKKITVEELTGLRDYVEANLVIEYCKDFALHRAAEACGIDDSRANKILKRDDVVLAINALLKRRRENAEIDAEWLKWELVDNHLIARQQGKLSASNTALHLLGKHAGIDAFAAEKVFIASDEAVKERLMRARERVTGDTKPVAQSPGEETSFY